MKKMMFLVLLALCFSLPGVNFYHHLSLPELDVHKITIHHTGFLWLNKTIDIRLNDEIKGSNSYKDVGQLLEDASSGDIIIFHLAGYGGDGQGLENLVNQLTLTKAYVIMSVEAPVYSAHAYLAVFGNELRMAPFSFLMFHTSSIYGINCSLPNPLNENNPTGTDRTVSNQEHCQAMYDTSMKLFAYMLSQISLLTADEKQAISTGHDVYLLSGDVKQRLNQ